MTDNIKQLVNAFKWVTILFIIILFQFVLVNQFIHADLNQFVGNYLSIYQNATNILQREGLPMWSPNIFLGGNFLGLQNTYSIYSPFFLITLLFPSRLLVDFFIPLLFLKTILAGGALYLYMKETKWFSPVTISIAMVLYLFNGWYFYYLNQFPFIDLMIYIPFALFGVEYLLSRGYRRYLVIALTLLLTSHFSFSLLFLPILFLYWLVRFNFLRHEKKINMQKHIKLILFTMITTIGINMVVLLPIILAGNTLRIDISGEAGIASLLSALFRTFFPTFHASYRGQLELINLESLVLFQTVLVILLLPQFLKLLPKSIKATVSIAYSSLMIIVLMTQTFTITNVTGLVPFNLNVLNLLFLLFNALIVAYVLNETNNLDYPLLKKTSWIYKLLITVIFMGVFLYESNLLNVNFKFEELKNLFLFFSSYGLIYFLLIILIDIYRHLLKLMATEHHLLRRKTMFCLIIFECIISSYFYLETHSQNMNNLVTTINDQQYIGNKAAAISNYLQAIDSNFHRVITSFQTHGNEPLRQDFNGFSISNRHLINEDLSWIFDEQGQGFLSNEFLTTALGAKYYLTADSVTSLPGYEFFDRIHGVTIYENRYFASIGKRSEVYILESEFKNLTLEEKKYVFLQAVILPDETTLMNQFNLIPFDLNAIPDKIGDVQYFKAAQRRKDLSLNQINFKNNKFMHDFSTGDPVLLVYMIPYECGWHASANGEPLTIHRVNQGFIAIEIPEAGNYEIILEYRTPGLSIGLGIAAVMLVLIIGHFYKQREDIDDKAIKKSNIS